MNAAEALFCPSRGVGLKMGILATHARTEILDLHQERGAVFQLARRAQLYIVFVNKEIDISLCRFSTLRWQAPTHLPS